MISGSPLKEPVVPILLALFFVTFAILTTQCTIQNKLRSLRRLMLEGSRFLLVIKAADRTRHVYVIGKTGMGKSTLLENMAVQDIKNGNGLAFIDPHGQTAETLLDYIPEERKDDVVYFCTV